MFVEKEVSVYLLKYTNFKVYILLKGDIQCMEPTQVNIEDYVCIFVTIKNGNFAFNN